MPCTFSFCSCGIFLSSPALGWRKVPEPPCFASSLDDEVDLNAGPQRQRGHPDRRAGGKGLTEMLCVDVIHRAEVTHAREIHSGARNVIETLARRLQNRREISKD